MNKTPVTILQELCVKRKLNPPFYELIEDGSNPTKTFTFKLNVLNQVSIGSGRSKKDAKHEAANEMLRLLQTQSFYKPQEVPTVSQNYLSIDGNSVGELLDICVHRNITLPEFKLMNASGPSHAPIFTYECAINTIKRTASHSTKKGAKQLVAQIMVDILQKVSFIENLSNVFICLFFIFDLFSFFPD